MAFTTDDITVKFWGSFLFIKFGFNGISKVQTVVTLIKSAFAELWK